MYKASNKVKNIVKSKFDSYTDLDLIAEQGSVFNPLLFNTHKYIIGIKHYSLFIPTEPLLDSDVEALFNKDVSILEDYINSNTKNLTQDQGDVLFLFGWMSSLSNIRFPRLSKLFPILEDKEYNQVGAVLESARFLALENNQNDNDINDIYSKSLQAELTQMFDKAFKQELTALNKISNTNTPNVKIKPNKTTQKRSNTKLKDVSTSYVNIQSKQNIPIQVLKLQTIGEYFDENRFLLTYNLNKDKSGHVNKGKIIGINEVLLFTSNCQNIISKYTEEECITYFNQKKYDIYNKGVGIISSSYLTLSKVQRLPLYINTQLNIPSKYTSNLFNKTQSKLNTLQIKETDVNQYLQKQIDKYLDKQGYVIHDKEFDNYLLQKRNGIPFICCWSKVLNQIINLTPFIVGGLSISTTTKSANIRFELAPLPGILTQTKDGKRWDLNNKKAIIDNNFVVKNYINKLHTHNLDNNRRTTLFFERVLSHNDPIFVSYDLDIDNELNRKFIINPVEFKDVSYETIGLIEPLDISFNEMSNDMSIAVNGQNLMKLLSEDGSYSHYLKYINKNATMLFADNDSINQTSFKRLSISGDSNTTTRFQVNKAIRDLQNPLNFKIDILIKTLFQSLANIEVCSGEIFNFWNDVTMFTDDNGKQDTPQGIWKIFKIFIDKEVADLMPFDASLTTYEGSLIGYLNKICQLPFVEFLADTYGDKFVLIIRKPPFTLERFLKLPTVNITTQDVYSDSLKNDTTCYSWYNLTPKAHYLGGVTDYNFITAVFLNEYAKIWGSQPLDVSHTYIPQLENNSDHFYLKLIKDLKEVIEMNAYLPFSRKGSIVLNRRRDIKVGTKIYYEPTNEYFYVDTVNHNFTHSGEGVIDESTTLNVSRGLVKDYCIAPKSSSDISYFNLVEFEFDNEILRQESNNLKESTADSPWIKKADVNKPVFEFFLKRNNI